MIRRRQLPRPSWPEILNYAKSDSWVERRYALEEARQFIKEYLEQRGIPVPRGEVQDALIEAVSQQNALVREHIRLLIDVVNMRNDMCYRRVEYLASDIVGNIEKLREIFDVHNAPSKQVSPTTDHKEPAGVAANKTSSTASRTRDSRRAIVSQSDKSTNRVHHTSVKKQPPTRPATAPARPPVPPVEEKKDEQRVLITAQTRRTSDGLDLRGRVIGLGALRPPSRPAIRRKYEVKDKFDSLDESRSYGDLIRYVLGENDYGPDYLERWADERNSKLPSIRTDKDEYIPYVPKQKNKVTGRTMLTFDQIVNTEIRNLRDPRGDAELYRLLGRIYGADFSDETEEARSQLEDAITAFISTLTRLPRAEKEKCIRAEVGVPRRANDDALLPPSARPTAEPTRAAPPVVVRRRADAEVGSNKRLIRSQPPQPPSAEAGHVKKQVQTPQHPIQPSPVSVELTIPALGESGVEATITRWLKLVGEQVVADEPVAEVETDKVSVQIPAPQADARKELERSNWEYDIHVSYDEEYEPELDRLREHCDNLFKQLTMSNSSTAIRHLNSAISCIKQAIRLRSEISDPSTERNVIIQLECEFIHEMDEAHRAHDEHTFTKKADKKKVEYEAAMRILDPFYYTIYDDVENQRSQTAKYAKAIDKITADIFDYLNPPLCTVIRFKQFTGLEKDDIIPTIVKHNRPYMLWNPFMTKFYDFLMEKLGEKLSTVL